MMAARSLFSKCSGHGSQQEFDTDQQHEPLTMTTCKPPITKLLWRTRRVVVRAKTGR